MLYVIATLVACTVGSLSIDAAGTPTDYCKICADHTMCIYPSVGRVAGDRSSVPSKDIKVILAAHNACRNKVAQGLELRGAPGPQPQAANMAKLVWDPELAKIAQRWANETKIDHDKCRNTANTYVGQNYHAVMSSVFIQDVDWNAPVKAWCDEVQFFSKNSVAPFSFNWNAGHYTQVVWAATRRVGCGVAKYQDPATKWYNTVTFCNYGPGGNVAGLGNSLYKLGKPCTQCPAATLCDVEYKGLCA